MAGIFVLCSFSLCLASDALLEFSWEFFFKIFVILLLDLFSNFVLVRIKRGTFLFVVSLKLLKEHHKDFSGLLKQFN